jgi:signal transduction histidine kinase
LSCKDGHFVMVISDDGRGFDPAGHVVGQGLTSMRERARSLGGRIEWTSEKGTVVTLRVPLPE